MTEATKSLTELAAEATDVKGRISDLKQRRADLLRDAISAGRAGQSPNGARAKLLEADAELDILRGTLAQVEAEMPAAERAAVGARVAEIVEGAKRTRDEAQAVAASASKALRELVTGAREMERLRIEYHQAVDHATNIAQAAGVPAPQVNRDLLSVVFPASPDQWGVGHWWTRKVTAFVGELGQVVTALDAAEHWNRKEGDR